MRFQITLEPTRQGVLPLNYQYELSSWIYKTLNHGNSEFAKWLHREGYINDYKRFKLFTFSNLKVPEFSIDGDRMHIESDVVKLIVSFYPIDSLEYFISGLFHHQEFSIGDKKSKASFKVRTVEKLSEPEFCAVMEFRSLSPVLISHKKSPEQKHADYKHPTSNHYGKLLMNNLAMKYQAFYGRGPEVIEDAQLDNKEEPVNGHPEYGFEVLSKAKSRLITIKSGTGQESKLRGYLYRFRLKAPSELIRLGYYAGFGEKNSLGFGCAETDKNNYITS